MPIDDQKKLYEFRSKKTGIHSERNHPWEQWTHTHAQEWNKLKWPWCLVWTILASFGHLGFLSDSQNIFQMQEGAQWSQKTSNLVRESHEILFLSALSQEPWRITFFKTKHFLLQNSWSKSNELLQAALYTSPSYVYKNCCHCIMHAIELGV